MIAGAMRGMIVRRVLQSIPLLVLISVLVFALLQAVPGGPLAPRDDPDATVTGPMAALMKLGDQDPEDTLKPQPRVDDPEDAFNGAFADFDPDATVSSPPVMRRRANPFAPKALPEALQANLAALGGLNPLIAYANPILSAVPQIRESLQHPAPELLMETLEDLVEAFEAGAANSGTSCPAFGWAVCALEGRHAGVPAEKDGACASGTGRAVRRVARCGGSGGRGIGLVLWLQGLRKTCTRSRVRTGRRGAGSDAGQGRSAGGGTLAGPAQEA